MNLCSFIAIGQNEIKLVNTERTQVSMVREEKDIVATVAEKTNRNVLRILHTHGTLTGAEIGRKLQEASKIRFKSTSTISETMARLQRKALVERKDSRYSLTDKSRAKWVVQFLNLLVKEKIDKGEIIK